jgi:hypothetical protein
MDCVSHGSLLFFRRTHNLQASERALFDTYQNKIKRSLSKHIIRLGRENQPTRTKKHYGRSKKRAAAKPMAKAPITKPLASGATNSGGNQCELRYFLNASLQRRNAGATPAHH